MVPRTKLPGRKRISKGGSRHLFIEEKRGGWEASRVIEIRIGWDEEGR